MEYEVNTVAALQIATDALQAYLTAQGVEDEKIFDAKLAAREILENVLRHAKTTAHFSFGLSDGFIRLSIRSKSEFCPTERAVCSSVYSEHGRGLFLVESVSSSVTIEQGLTEILIKV